MRKPMIPFVGAQFLRASPRLTLATFALLLYGLAVSLTASAEAHEQSGAQDVDLYRVELLHRAGRSVMNHSRRVEYSKPGFRSWRGRRNKGIKRYEGISRRNRRAIHHPSSAPRFRNIDHPTFVPRYHKLLAEKKAENLRNKKDRDQKAELVRTENQAEQATKPTSPKKSPAPSATVKNTTLPAIPQRPIAPAKAIPPISNINRGPVKARKQLIKELPSKVAMNQSSPTNNQSKETTVTRATLESVLDVPGVKCGKVPVYEKLYHQSINETLEINPETGEFRILHGLDSVVGEWPWLVRILECQDEDSCNTCTGTLLNDRWIITAGHCAHNRSGPDKFTATFGLYDLVSPDNGSYSLPVERLIVHPDYNELNNDLTLIKLAKPVTFSDHVRPACLVQPTRDVLALARAKRCYSVGYGLVNGMEDAVRLQKLEIRAKEPSECNSYDLGGSQLRPGTVCIGPPSGKLGSSCKGDSGGPNLCYDSAKGSWFLFATVSFGPPVCDRENGDKWLTVSVDLSNYRTWILSTILENS